MLSRRRKLIIYTFGFLLISTPITYLIANKYGKRIELVEAGIYRKLVNKQSQHLVYDSAGIPMVVYESGIGKQYNPLTIAENAMRWADEFDSTRFFSSIDWLVKNSVLLNDSSIIFYNYFDWPLYEIKAPFRSAMSQGRISQAFLKAYKLTGDSVYLEYSEGALNTLFTEVKEGGVTYIDDSGYWYEEYADDSIQQTRVLNGMIVVLQALSGYYEVTNDPKADFLFWKGVNELKTILYKYDNNGHSFYDITGKPADEWYHAFHIELLDFLYKKTGCSEFLVYKEKWKLYKPPSYLRSTISNPSNIGLFAIFTIYSSIFLLLFITGIIITSIVQLKNRGSSK